MPFYSIFRLSLHSLPRPMSNFACARRVFPRCLSHLYISSCFIIISDGARDSSKLVGGTLVRHRVLRNVAHLDRDQVITRSRLFVVLSRKFLTRAEAKLVTG